MFGGVSAAAVGVVGGIITLAIIAVIVSQRAQTPQVLQAGGQALSSIIGAAVKPVSDGGSSNLFGSIGQGIGGITL